MTFDMQTHTHRLAVRLALIIFLFTILSTALAVLLRYRESLDTLLANHQAIQHNLPKMRLATAQIHDTITEFKRLLPSGYEHKTAEMLLYTRLDEVKNRLPSGEMTVKPLETKEGFLTLEFSFKPANQSYNSLLNTLGQLELAVLPFVSIRRVSVEGPTKEKTGQLAITVEGILLTQASARDSGASPDSTPAPVPAAGGTR